MRLDVLQPNTLCGRDRPKRTNLVNDKVLDVARRYIKLAASEALEVRKSRVRPYGNVMGSRQRNSGTHYSRPSRVKATCDVGGRDVGHQGRVLPRFPQQPLTYVSIQVYPHACQLYTLVILATELEGLRFEKPWVFEETDAARQLPM